MADKQPLATFLAAVHGAHVSGTGNPDGGLFTSNQFDRKTEATKNQAEVKAFTSNARRIAALVHMREALDASYAEVVLASP